MVPIEEYNRLYTTRYEISEKTLALILMKAQQRMVEKNGVRVNGFSYIHPDLAYYKKQNVEVRYSESDYTRCFIIPPPTEAIPNPAIIEAEAVIAGGALHPNKQSMALVAQQRRHEDKIKREHSLLTHSMIRGESVEDRVAAQLEPDEEWASEAVAVAGGGGGGSAFGGGRAASSPPSDGLSSPARVHQLTRLDRLRITAPRASQLVTVDQVRDTATDESIFEELEEPASGGVRLWDDEE